MKLNTCRDLVNAYSAKISSRLSLSLVLVIETFFSAELVNSPLSNQNATAKCISWTHRFEHVTPMFVYSVLLSLMSVFLV